MKVIRTEHHIRPDPSRLVLRPFMPGAAHFGGDPGRLDQVVDRALELPADESHEWLHRLQQGNEDRFPGIAVVWRRHFELARTRSSRLEHELEEHLQLLIGAILTETYAYEAAALTNPSMVPMGAVADGAQRFVMSARAIGEGHISSIAFMTGSVDETGEVALDSRYGNVSNGDRKAPDYSRNAFAAKLEELGLMNATSRRILSLVPETFSAEQLQDALGKALDSDLDNLEVQDSVKRMHWLADSNYQLRFDSDLPLSEHVISPGAPSESRGIEDARFVRFTDDDGSITYYATYTAYDGLRILPQMIETSDFCEFRMATMTGPAIHHKGMAIFPRKIDGEYVALSRHDHERSFVLRSDNIRSWTNAELVFGPENEWDIVQTGNCGSPIETDAGWLVITHGVGAMRRYVLGAVLLDLDEPTKVLGRLRAPLIEAEGDETVGYVPDVVYSCGSMLHAGNVIIPFGYSDVGIKIAVTSLSDLLAAMD
jgi:predicted GH43/DUF377 family glycosyl hydrolase